MDERKFGIMVPGQPEHTRVFDDAGSAADYYAELIRAGHARERSVYRQAELEEKIRLRLLPGEHRD